VLAFSFANREVCGVLPTKSLNVSDKVTSNEMRGHADRRNATEHHPNYRTGVDPDTRRAFEGIGIAVGGSVVLGLIFALAFWLFR
jgi:hypothetical protein